MEMFKQAESFFMHLSKKCTDSCSFKKKSQEESNVRQNKINSPFFLSSRKTVETLDLQQMKKLFCCCQKISKNEKQASFFDRL